MDKEWYKLFKQNAYKDGTLKIGEKRDGVNKKRINDISKIKKISKLNLIQSVSFHSLITNLLKNKIDNINEKII